MNKSDLVTNVAKASGLTKADAERAIDATFQTITKSLKKGDDVRLIGFGTFATANRKATEGRNPRTGEKIKIPAKRLPMHAGFPRPNRWKVRPASTHCRQRSKFWPNANGLAHPLTTYPRVFAGRRR